MEIPSGSTVKLTHFGRRSGKPFTLTIWYVDVGGELWIGSLDSTRNWVRNLAASGRCVLDFGDGPREMRAVQLDSPAAVEKHRLAVAAKYPILSRIIGLFGRGKQRVAFRLEAADPATG